MIYIRGSNQRFRQKFVLTILIKHMSLPRFSIVAIRVTLSITLAVIMYLATTPYSYPVVEDLNDKVSHILAFGTLAFLTDFSFPIRKFGLHKFLWLLSYGLLIEFIQYFLPYREASVFDVMADCAGLAVYWAFYSYLKYVPLLRLRWL
jgi:VanZ family protein